jgi:hypothetical protein
VNSSYSSVGSALGSYTVFRTSWYSFFEQATNKKLSKKTQRNEHQNNVDLLYMDIKVEL